MRTRTDTQITSGKRRSRLVVALCALTASLSLVPAGAGAAASAAQTSGQTTDTSHDSDSAVKIGFDPLRQLASSAHTSQTLTVQLLQQMTVRVRFYQQKTWYLQQVMGVHLSRHARPRRTLDAVNSTLRYWRRQAAAAWQRFTSPPNFTNWLCIQRHETAPPYPAWRTDSHNGYFGGVQMDMTFQHNYGSFLLRLKGTADHWTRLEQIWVAEKGRRVQGWGAWPNSSRACGL